MPITLTEYEKKNGVKILVSPDTYKYKYMLKDNKIIILCRHKNCLLKGNRIFHMCEKHLKLYQS